MFREVAFRFETIAKKIIYICSSNYVINTREANKNYILSSHGKI